MRLSQAILSRYLEVPEETRALRDLLDDLGLEVKRVETTDAGPVFTLELLANRGDHHCYAGLAREIRGRTGGEISLPTTTDLRLGSCPIPLRSETPLCLKYTGTLLVRTGKPMPLPDAELAVLRAAGLHSVSAPVDATNLSNIELGQPTHAFDADTIRGGVVIRTSFREEAAWPLFQPGPVVLPEGTLVIADDEKILAIAGVIGCEESKTTEATTRLLLESATFDPVAVRKASRALNLHTDASTRFERGADPTMPLVGAGRVVALLEGTGAWRREGSTGQVGDWSDPLRILDLEWDAAAAALAARIDREEIQTRLRRYGYEVRAGEGATLWVRVPPHRLWDVEHPADLVEDLAKSIGYNNTPTTLPKSTQGVGPTHGQEVNDRVSEVLVGSGFYEVITDGFYSRSHVEKLGLPADHPWQRHVEVLNAVDRGYSLVKNNALVQAVEAVANGIRRKHEDILLFEWTRVFRPRANTANGVCIEEPLLWAIATGDASPRGWEGSPRPADIWFLKGIVEEIGVALGLPLRVAPAQAEDDGTVLFHPGRQGRVYKGEQTIGTLGEVHPRVARAFGIKRERLCYLEIWTSSLLQQPERPPFTEPSAMQPIDRDLAFTLPHRFEAGRVAEALVEARPAGLLDVRMTDLFAHLREDKPVRTVTYALRFSQDDGPRTADEINAVMKSLVSTIEARFGADGVSLRGPGA